MDAQDSEGADDVDLYGDLFTEHGESETLLKARVAELEERLREQEGVVAGQAKEISDLRAQVATLGEEKAVLVRNISCVYRTAVEEIGRKDSQIKELRGKLMPAS